MPDYNLYKLTNSNEIPRFVGSPVPELAQAFQVQQGKYDTALAISDEIENGVKGASSLTQDQALLQQLKDKYRGKIKEYAERGDYENMVRETTRDAKEFSREYTPIMANQKAVSAYRDEVEKLQKDNKISKKLADAAFEYSTNTYKGLQKDPVTGQYRNQFTGYIPGKELDISDFVKKALQDINPQTIGSNVRKVVTVNGAEFYQEVGGKTVKLPMERLRPFIEAYKSQSAEYQTHVAQEKLLNNWKLGTLNSDNIMKLAAEGQIPAQMYEQATKLVQEQGMTLPQAIKLIGESRTAQNIDRDVDIMTAKYIRDDYESTNKLMGETEKTGRDEAAKAKASFGVRYNALNNQGNITGVPDFNKKLAVTEQEVTTHLQAFDNFLYDPNLTIKRSADGSTVTYLRKDPLTGKMLDVTEEGKNLKNQVDRARDQETQLRQIKTAAQKEAGYSPNNVTDKEVGAALQETLNDPILGFGAIGDGFRSIFNSMKATFRGNPQDLVDQALNGLDADARAKERFKNSFNSNLEKKVPSYGKYQQVLKERVNGTTQENSMVSIDDDQARKDLGNLVTGLAGNGVGLKQGLISLSIGTGADAGTQLSAEEYDKIQNDITPVGIISDANGGKIKVILRTTQEIKGKKVTGENIIMESDNITGIDDYLKKTMQPVDYARFHVGKDLKQRLATSTNPSGITDIPVPGTDASIRVVRTNKGGSPIFKVQVPMDDGTIAERTVNNYDAVADVIMYYQYGVPPKSKE